MKNTILTEKERNFLFELDKPSQTEKIASFLGVKKYFGQNSSLRQLNGTTQFIGTAEFIGREDCWYVKAINGETYRLPEPKDGIETILELEYKRKEKN